MRELPQGTVTLLFIDIEGSTRLLQQLGDRYIAMLEECRHLIRVAIRQWNGHEVDTQGDAFFVAFARATDAVSATVTTQRALASHPWPEGVTVRVRMGLHTGEPQRTAEGYVGLDVHHAARVMSVGHGGQVVLSRTTQDLVEHTLPEGVSLRNLGQHRLKDLQHPSHLSQLVIADLPTDFPPLKTLDSHPHNLPIQPTPFIGREREVAAVQQLLEREDVRLLTLTGPGGSGKTRLGLQVAAELSDGLGDGIFFVNLAPLSDPALVMPTIAQALGLKEAAGQMLLDLVSAWLREKEVLLLLDNFEQVVEAAVEVAVLLARCSRLNVLVTSRAVLHVRGEHEFAVPPLAIPDPRHLPDLVALSQYEAVALFIARAQAINPEFEVTTTNAPAVAEICIRLDGLPLAIELAAARIKLLPPQALLARMGERLAVLSSAARDVPERQQTLHNTIAWSYHLLNVWEQRLFRWLCVFVGSFTLEAIEMIVHDTSDETINVLNTVASLIDKSLVQQIVQETVEPRLIILETVREYGLECLRESGEDMLIRHAHALYYLSMAEEAEPHFRGAQQIIWWDRLEREQDNIRTALSWFISRQEEEPAFRVCGALYWFWYIRGYWSEGRQWITSVLELPQASKRTAGRAKLLCAACLLDNVSHGYETDLSLFEESVEIYREQSDKRGLALSLSWLGFLSPYQDTNVGRAMLEESIVLCQEVGEKWILALSLEHLGWSYLDPKHFAQAAGLWEKSISLYRELGDEQGMAETLDGLAELALNQGNMLQAEALWKEQLHLSRKLNEKRTTSDALNALGRLEATRSKLSQAEALCQESLILAQEIGYNYGIAAAISSLGHFARRRGDNAQAAIWAEKNLILNRGPFELFDAGQSALDQGDVEQATLLFQEGFSLGQENRDEPTIAHFLRGFALLALEKQQLQKAAHLFGAAENLLIGTIDLFGQTEYKRALERVRAQLGEKAFASAWDEGGMMTPEQALAAQEIAMLLTWPTTATPVKSPVTPAGLTAREAEVLRLLAQGLTSAQITERLVISLVTVNSHVRSIYSKLGVTSRSAATRYAIEHHLL
jgi:predicted ATPase/class 3 adenylate cyclase/DNA-binding CsgD family transcriptional regulator